MRDLNVKCFADGVAEQRTCCLNAPFYHGAWREDSSVRFLPLPFRCTVVWFDDSLSWRYGLSVLRLRLFKRLRAFTAAETYTA
jgi:hypothetical protein